MDEFVRTIFQNAILREESAYRMYNRLADKATGQIKDLLLKIAEEELIHRSLFAKMDVSILKIVNKAQIKLNLLDTKKEQLSYENAREINNVLDLAIAEEQKAYDDYNTILRHLEFGDAREMLKEISVQELKHKQMLQKVKLEFNSNDWDVI